MLVCMNLCTHKLHAYLVFQAIFSGILNGLKFFKSIHRTSPNLLSSSIFSYIGNKRWGGGNVRQFLNFLFWAIKQFPSQASLVLEIGWFLGFIFFFCLHWVGIYNPYSYKVLTVSDSTQLAKLTQKAGWRAQTEHRMFLPWTRLTTAGLKAVQVCLHIYMWEGNAECIAQMRSWGRIIE